MQYSDQQKRARKKTIEVDNLLKILDAESRPTAPPKIIYHPRAFSPSSWCQSGFHTWATRVVMGVPVLYCKKCGTFRYKEIYENTMSKNEMRKRVPVTEAQRETLVELSRRNKLGI